MNAEKINVIFPEGKDKAELIIREVNTIVEKELPATEPMELSIKGAISAPYSFLEKRWNAADGQIDHSRTHIRLNRDNMSMELVINERDERACAVISGKIELSRQCKAFALNTGKQWTPEDLGNFFKINRTYFESTDENMKLVTILKSLKAKINVALERTVKDNGSVTDTFQQVVDSNIPEKISVNIPIFKNTQPEKVEIEFISRVNAGREISIELISPDVEAIIETVRDKVINEQLEKIKALAPEIPIIEI